MPKPRWPEKSDTFSAVDSIEKLHKGHIFAADMMIFLNFCTICSNLSYWDEKCDKNSLRWLKNKWKDLLYPNISLK